jgi:hypothetical protein
MWRSRTPAGVRCAHFPSVITTIMEEKLHVKFLLWLRPIHMWRSRTPAGIRCAHFPSVITTIMIGSQTTAVETVDQTWVVYHVAEPFPLNACIPVCVGTWTTGKILPYKQILFQGFKCDFSQEFLYKKQFLHPNQQIFRDSDLDSAKTFGFGSATLVATKVLSKR